MSVRSIAVFIVTGGVTTVVHVLAGLAAHYLLGLDAFNANLVAFAVAFFVSYFGHKNFSFRSPGRVRRSMPRFFVVSVTNLFLNQFIVYSLSTAGGHPYWLSLAVMVAVVPAFTYILSRVWVFSDGDF
ncbi:GtrA family protein (plasmid) [Roseobacteraceae bacterium NS-SX3]